MFGGFKKTMNLFGRKNTKDLRSELTPDMCVSGAYRSSRDDFYGFRTSFEQPKKKSSDEVLQQMRPTKSASDLTKPKNAAPNLPNLRNIADEVSTDPRGAEQGDPRNGTPSRKDAKNHKKEKKKLENQRLAEQKAREKQAAQEQAKQEKLKKEREKRESQQAKPKKKSEKKKPAPQPKPQASNPVQTSTVQYSTNTLDSSISRSTGPPPYSPTVPEQTSSGQSKTDVTGNVTYKKPVDEGSWDIISQHRQQIKPNTTIGGADVAGARQRKQMVMDLNYNFEAQEQSVTKDNSEA